MKSKSFLFLSITLLFFSNFLWGQTEKLTLQKAIEHALAENPVIKQMEANLKAKQAEWKGLTGIHDPELILMKEGVSNNTDPAFSEQRIGISQSVDFPLTSVYRVKKSKREAAALQLQLEAAKREAIYEVKLDYIQLLYTISYKNLADEQKELANSLAEAVKTKAQAGAGNGMDQLKTEIQLAQAENDIEYAKRILHQARYDLFNTMGLDVEEQKYSIEFSDTLKTKDEKIAQHVALDYVDKHPYYEAILQETEAAAFGVKEARSEYLPNLNFSLYTQDYGDGFGYTGFEVGVSIPLWFAFNQSSKIQQAKYKKEALEWHKKEVHLDIKLQIEHAWHNYEASRNNVLRFKEIISSKSTELKNLTFEAYQLGEIDLLNLLNAQQIYLDTRKNYLTALQDYYLQIIKLEKYMNTEIVY
jgi:cobalt-zinc-cadmium efflux system outer membrane protein